ncbi:type II CAAX endopeptidase family protein [Nocardia sp. NPDC048505]|uniref:CPBP family intramembrane glutamic endopeptidase n=1 Tax=unclassified Nocardia TaxID=2637762 RepID=UPI0033FF0335
MTSTEMSDTAPVGVVRAPTTARFWTILGVYALSTLTASAALIAAQPHSGIDPAALSLVQFGPALGALITWLIFRKTVSELLPAPVSWRRVGANAGAMVAVCVLFWLAITAGALLSDIDMVGPAAVGAVPFAVFVALQLLGACGEEIGWRGVMQPLLESRMAKFAAIAATGATWALWHVQAFVVGPVPAVCFFLSAMSFAIVLGYVASGSFYQRVMVASIGHWLINVAWYLLAGDNTLDRPQIVFEAVAAVLIAVVVLGARSYLDARRIPLRRRGTPDTPAGHGVHAAAIETLSSHRGNSAVGARQDSSR